MVQQKEKRKIKRSEDKVLSFHLKITMMKIMTRSMVGSMVESMVVSMVESRLPITTGIMMRTVKRSSGSIERRRKTLVITMKMDQTLASRNHT